MLLLSGCLVGLYATHVILTQAEIKAYLDSSKNDEITFDTYSECNSSPMNYVSRSSWLAQPPQHDLTKLELPNRIVIIAHTVNIHIFF